MAWKAWSGGFGDWSNSADWSGGGSPSPGDTIYSTGGKITATGVDTTGDFIWLNTAAPRTFANLQLDNMSLGAGSFTLLQGQHSGLELDNASLQGTIYENQGQGIITVLPGTYAQNFGWMVAAGSLPAEMMISAQGSFANYGDVTAASNGIVIADFGQNAYVFNNGVMQAEQGGALQITYDGPGGPLGGTFGNQGNVLAAGGSVTINANLYQGPNARTTVSQNGELTLGGASTGGTIAVESGMLNFAPTQFAAGPYAAANFNSALAFTGDSGSLNFGNTLVFEEFNAATNELIVFTPYQEGTAQVADIHLSGSYTAADFSVNGGSVVSYTRNPPASTA